MKRLKDYFDCMTYLRNKGYREFNDLNGYEFYRFVFPNCENVGEMNQDFSKPNPVYLYSDFKTERLRRRIFLNDTFESDYSEFVDSNRFALCGGLSYRGRTNKLEHAQHMNALIFDVDSVGLNELKNFFHKVNLPEKMLSVKLPAPTFLVLSGAGMHVYYVFKEPIDLFPNIKLQLKSLKYDLTEKIWKYGATSKQRDTQYQGINQTFRMVGSLNAKYGNHVVAFQVGDKVDLEYLNGFVMNERNKVDILERFRPSKCTLKEAQEKYPQWYQRVIVEGVKNKDSKWHIHRGLYEWWIKQIGKVKGGHRYFYLMCMAIYAYKCDISKKELKKDMLEAYKFLKFEVHHTNNLEKRDFMSALESYDKGLARFTIKDIEKITGIRIDRNKRNGRKQAEHLKIASFVKDLKYPNGEWRQGNGRPSKEKEVQEWQKLHPNGTKAQCHKDTKISRQTIHKFWQNAFES